MNDPHHQSQVPAAAKKRKYLVDVFTPTNNKVKKTESANISWLALLTNGKVPHDHVVVREPGF